jgi:hypothetical protein
MAAEQGTTNLQKQLIELCGSVIVLNAVPACAIPLHLHYPHHLLPSTR